MDNLSLADISAVTRGDGFLEGNGIIILILFFLLLGGNGGFGWGNNGRGFAVGDSIATTMQVYDSNNQQNILNGLAGIKEAVNYDTYETSRQIDGVNHQGIQNTYAITNAMDRGFDGINAQLSALGFQMSQCCCDLKTQMLQDKYDDVRYQLEQANTAIANAVQSQNILGNLGRYVINPPCYGNGYGYGTGYGYGVGYGFNGTTIA